MKKKILIIILFLSCFKLYAGSLHNQQTVYLIKNGYSSVEFYQKTFYSPDGNFLLNRSQKLYLSITDNLELGIDVPYINYIKDNFVISNLGDIKFHLNYATHFFRKYLKLNYYFEFNYDNGPQYNNTDLNPILNYGYQEWKIGIITFKKLKYFSIHFNLSYIIKSENELTLFDVIRHGILPNTWKEWYENKSNLILMGTGIITNVIPIETFLLGKDAQEIATEMNQSNTLGSQESITIDSSRIPIENDNIEYVIAINSDLTYPFVPYIEFLFAHDLLFNKSKQYYENKIKRPGSGYLNIQLTIGTKYFMIDDNFIINTAIVIPLGAMREIVSIGYTLGVKLNF